MRAVKDFSFHLRLLFFLLAGIPATAVAQNPGISGRVTDSTAERGVSGARVLLIEKQVPADTMQAVTNEKGLFFFSRIPSNTYTISVTYTGYAELRRDFFKPSAGVSQIDLGDFVLSATFKLLEEVIIEAPPITVKEDTVEYRASAFPTKPNATTEDLLKKLPGVQVDRNGNVTAQGKSVTRIKVNGKDFFSGDPKTATRELPAELIDKVQVIDDYGDQAAISGIREGESEKIINLELRKDKNKGWFGRAMAGVGTQERYQTSATANYFNNRKQISVIENSNNTNQSLFNTGEMSGFGGRGGGGGASAFSGDGGGFGFRGMGAALGNLVNSNTGQSQDGITRLHAIGTNLRSDFGKRNSIYGSYVYTNRKLQVDQFTSQQNLLTFPKFTNVTDQETINRQGTHRAFLNVEYWIDSFNYVKVSPNLSVQNSRNLLSNQFDIFRTTSVLPAQKGDNNDTTFSQRPSFRTGILYNHRFYKRGRNFSMNMDLGWNSQESDQVRLNQTGFFNFDGTPNFSIAQQQQIAQSNRNRSYNIRAVYSEPVLADRFLDISYNFNHSFSTNNRSTSLYDFSSALYQTIDSLSNDFENRFNFSRFGAALRTVKKKYNYTIGLQMQPVVLRGKDRTKDSSFRAVKNVQWFPVARLSYNFSRSQSLNFNYSGSAQQPTFSQLQPVRDVTNPQFQSEGNPNLKPSVVHTINTTYNQFNLSSGKILFSSLTLSLYRNQIVNNTISIKNLSGQSTGAQLSRPENVNGAYNLNLFYTYSRPWKNRTYVLTLLGTMNFNRNVNLFDSEKNIGRNWIFMQGLNFDYNAQEWLELSAGLRYNLNYADYTIPVFLPQSQVSWVVTTDVRADLPSDWVLRLDFDYTINRGLAENVTGNIALLNVSVEKEILKKKNGTVKFQVFDLLNQNVNISRSVSANFITDSRVNRLSQYFLLSFQYRLNRFRAQNSGKSERGRGWFPGKRQ
jgi:hypothetical protein